MKTSRLIQLVPALLAVLAIAAVEAPEAGSRPATGPATIAIQLAGSGSGRVTGDYDAVDCPGRCSADVSNLYAAGIIPAEGIELKADPAPGSVFAGWSGFCSGVGSCRIPEFAGTRNVTARFERLIIFTTHQVSVEVSGNGSVTGTGIACPGDCGEKIARGASVTLTASATAGSSFAAWGGACSGSAPTCVLTVNAAANVTATFTPLPPPGTEPAPTPTPPGPPPANPAPTPQPTPASPQSPSGSCTLTGTEGDDILTGMPGRDVICGLGGNDTLVGAAGDDVLDGGIGTDVLLGGAGHDRLAGGAGRDTLAGGAGNDRLTGDAGVDRLNGDGGIDVIYARDRHADRIDGGPGLDRARLDRRVDHSRRIESVF